ncbi:PAS domain S-box [Desulfomonile tiedjei DSM 6799]|uniref:histidine kinase n=2 Tax=Desulfomonile tiedjei TaxID=2358 RepID=I4C0W4_DESTA|nr:PAS domain S-box [Desulfomonile tiedjei DSM 6799]
MRVLAETLIESISDCACLIGADARIVCMNSRSVNRFGNAVGRKCYKALAGLDDICPFCSFQDLSRGYGDPVIGQVQSRCGCSYLIDVKHLHDEQEGLVLEIIRTVNDGTPEMIEKNNLSMRPPLLHKLSSLLLVSRKLMSNAPFAEKMDSALVHVISGLEGSTHVWLELDDKVYGDKPEETGTEFVQEIMVEGKVRGRLVASYPETRKQIPEETYFLEESAGLIGRQVEVSDLWARLRQSEERYRKLAGNLAKEMWTRTEALAKETGYLEGILRCSEDMIITTDLDQRIVEFNPSAEKILGYSAEEVQGRKVTELWVDPTERDRLMAEVVLTGGIRNYQTQLKTKLGETVESSLSLSLLKDEQGSILGTVGVIKDVNKETALRKEQERLTQNYREAIHFINHETKNSLIVMGGFLSRLLKTETDPARRDQMQIVYHHSKFLEAMSRDFLVMAELEHGEFQVRKRLIHNFYKEVIYPAMIGLKERYPDSFQSYDASMGGVGAIALMGDPALLEIVYRNLFGNALKYRDPEKKVAYGVEEYPDHYLFNVWNGGPGVPHDQVEKIFEKFYRVHDETTRDKRGTGLGLYNIRRIIEAHGGRIWCETRPGEWVNFLFVLPKE